MGNCNRFFCMNFYIDFRSVLIRLISSIVCRCRSHFVKPQIPIRHTIYCAWLKKFCLKHLISSLHGCCNSVGFLSLKGGRLKGFWGRYKSYLPVRYCPRGDVHVQSGAPSLLEKRHSKWSVVPGKTASSPVSSTDAEPEGILISIVGGASSAINNAWAH